MEFTAAEKGKRKLIRKGIFTPIRKIWQVEPHVENAKSGERSLQKKSKNR